MWRGGGRSNISVSASFVWRCLIGSTVTPFPHPAHRTGQADLPHPALGQDLTPSPTARRAQARSGVRARSARKDAGVDKRSEERRVGKECRYRWGTYHYKKKMTQKTRRRLSRYTPRRVTSTAGNRPTQVD